MMQAQVILKVKNSEIWLEEGVNVDISDKVFSFFINLNQKGFSVQEKGLINVWRL